MARYRHELPQLSNFLFLTDGGIETTLVFREGLDLPHFAAFDLLKFESGYQTIKRYFETYVELARRHRTGFILESATWRANRDWGVRLGYSKETLADANHKAIAMLEDIRDRYETESSPMVISGCIGPRGDGYVAGNTMSEAEAEVYHHPQMSTFHEADVDLISAITMTYPEEAIGIVRAARALDLPIVISFTVETDGNLPTGQPLREALTQVDQATGHAPAYYMINCAHPTHFLHLMGEPWSHRIRGIRANASARSHAELNESVDLDDGNPAELASHYLELRKRLKNLNVVGGCCGTDERHVEAMCMAFLQDNGRTDPYEQLLGPRGAGTPVEVVAH